MKSNLCACLLALSPLVAFAADSAAPAPSVDVTVTSESKELAQGYAAAFSRLRRVPFHVQLDRDGRTTILSDIKIGTALNGVLVLETNKGLIYIVNPNDIVWISDAPVVPIEKSPAPAAK
jgi:hypothetical protein